MANKKNVRSKRWYLFRTLRWFNSKGKNTKNIIDDNKVIIAQEIEHNDISVITNWKGEALVARYYLSDNIVGGINKTKDIEHFRNMIRTIGPDYIFLIDPGSYLKPLFNIPEASNDKFLLIKIKQSDPLESEIVSLD